MTISEKNQKVISIHIHNDLTKELSYPLLRLLYSISVTQAETPQEILAHNFLFPTEKIVSEKLSLSDSIVKTEQIRYFLKNKSERVFRFLEEKLKKSPLEISFEVLPDFSSEEISFLQRMKNTIQIFIGKKESANQFNYSDFYSEVEKSWMHGELESKKCYELITDYMSVGDSQTALRILNAMRNHENLTSAFVLKASLLNMLGKIEEAREAYVFALKLSPEGEKAAIYYLLAMIELRFLKKDHSLRKAEIYLNIAFRSALDPEHYTDHEKLKFDRIFNRNGYALVLFEKELYAEAYALLEELSQELEVLTSEKARMHLSVLEYNKVQCLLKLAQDDLSEKTFEKLILLDPQSAEYRFEFAKYLENTAQSEKALVQIEKALQLDPYCWQYSYLKANVLISLNRYSEAKELLEVAREQFPENMKLCYSYFWVLSMLEDYAQILRLYEANPYFFQNSELYYDFLPIISEAYLNLHREVDGYELYRAALFKDPSSRILRESFQELECVLASC